MANKHQVLTYFDKHPTATSVDCAKALGCESAYVRATLYRAGRQLADGRVRSPEQLRADAAELIALAEQREARAAKLKDANA